MACILIIDTPKVLVEVFDHTSELGTYYSLFVNDAETPRMETESQSEVVRFARYLATR